ncbi:MULTISPECIES: response regulator transcription factor [unclassified Microbulbifer]|uniref:response regulator transcription factor n=1 Tax=unclassified Microbulbifer TaxID=2619833 RepID=UPI0027E4FC8D|nr:MULTISPECIES: response regulator transcription factor [unclassified Microbulbifer]
MIRVMVVDDQALVRRGFALVLDNEPDIEVVAEAGTGIEAIEAARAQQPDIILMDVRMPEMDGLEATARILQSAETAEAGDAACRIIILTTFDPDEYVFRALQAGASGFVLRDIPPEALVQAVRTVADGGAMLAPGITRRLISQFPQKMGTGRNLAERLQRLTTREREVLATIAAGKSNAEIAESGRGYCPAASPAADAARSNARRHRRVEHPAQQVALASAWLRAHRCPGGQSDCHGLFGLPADTRYARPSHWYLSSPGNFVCHPAGGFTGGPGLASSG